MNGAQISDQAGQKRSCGYARPDLKKGPKLGSIAADPVGSGPIG